MDRGRGVTGFLSGCFFGGVLACEAMWGLRNRCRNNRTRRDKTDPGGTSSGDSGSSGVGADSQPDLRDHDNSLGKHVFKDFIDDQKSIWTSPFHVRLVDAEWLVPLGGAAAAMFATDTEVSKHLSNSPSRISTQQPS